MLWFYAADIPYVDFECKNILFFFNFSKSLTFCIPDGDKKAKWPGGARQAKADGIDLVVPEWSWWLLADDTVELSCSHHGILGNLLAFYDMTKGIQITIPVSADEARRIRTAVQYMVDHADESLTRDKNLRILKPSSKVLAYPVKAFRWESTQRSTTASLHLPIWNPIV